MSEDALPEADCIPGAPHPRFSAGVLGQGDAELAFLKAAQSQNLHHAWLISGPRGAGKATLAWAAARYLRSPVEARGPDSLSTTDEGVVRRVEALSDPGITLLRRVWNEKTRKFSAGIPVDEVRKLNQSLSLSLPDGGWRVVIIDAADDLNRESANALLKSLEEPPQQTVFFLIAHQPARLLPTIRSRCRTLQCRSLSKENLSAVMARVQGVEPESIDQLQALAGGSASEALELIELEGWEIYSEIVDLLRDLPSLDRGKAAALADRSAGPQAQAYYGLLKSLILKALGRLALQGASGETAMEAVAGETQLFTRLCPSPVHARHWADLHQSLSETFDHATAVNLDPASVILDTCFKIEASAQSTIVAA